MSGFSADWLALREPADSEARSESLVRFVLGGADTGSMKGRLLDLGGGTGANIRYIRSRLQDGGHWTLVDNDPALLSRAPADVTTRCADLNDVVADSDLFRGCGAVTASALLDLVSEQWLVKLVGQCRASGAAVLFALNYDGRMACTPPEPEDEEVRRLVNRHQTSNKGFGPALGPAAAILAATLLTDAGYETKQAKSDWNLGRGHGELQRQLVAGWASAATEIAPERKPLIDDWCSRRVAHIDAGRSRIVVGHVDVAGVWRRA